MSWVHRVDEIHLHNSLRFTKIPRETSALQKYRESVKLVHHKTCYRGSGNFIDVYSLSHINKYRYKFWCFYKICRVLHLPSSGRARQSMASSSHPLSEVVIAPLLICSNVSICRCPSSSTAIPQTMHLDHTYNPWVELKTSQITLANTVPL